MEEKGKHPTSFRLTPIALRLLKLTAKQAGIAKSAIIEVAIRDTAVRYGVK